MSYDYLNLKAGAPQRLRRLRRDFEKWLAKNPKGHLKSWRDVRYATFKSNLGLYQGFKESDNGPLAPKDPIWYTQSGQFFRREQYADEVKNSHLDHTGWFTNSHQEGKYRGLVVSLPHGRFLAGYHSDDNDERVYFDDVYDDITDAITAADEAARIDAERECEYNDRYDEARKLENECEEAEQRIQELFALRNHKSLGKGSRQSMAYHLGTLREKREKLSTDFKDVLS